MLFGTLSTTTHPPTTEQRILCQPIYQPWQQGLAILGIKADRRAMRMMVKALSWQWVDNDVLVLDFCLPAGSFATSLLEYLSEHLIDGSQIEKEYGQIEKEYGLMK